MDEQKTYAEADRYSPMADRLAVMKRKSRGYFVQQNIIPGLTYAEAEDVIRRAYEAGYEDGRKSTMP